jgi:hypothetical protein
LKTAVFWDILMVVTMKDVVVWDILHCYFCENIPEDSILRSYIVFLYREANHQIEQHSSISQKTTSFKIHLVYINKYLSNLYLAVTVLTELSWLFLAATVLTELSWLFLFQRIEVINSVLLIGATTSVV